MRNSMIDGENEREKGVFFRGSIGERRVGFESMMLLLPRGEGSEFAHIGISWFLSHGDEFDAMRWEREKET